MTRMHDFTGAPCVSFDPDEQALLIRLFDSVEPADHAYAAAMCRTCEHQTPCENRRREVVDTYSGRAYEGPHGTWAGKKYGKRQKGVAK